SDLALYIFLFPQLIAGPILRWNSLGPQLKRRLTTLEKMAEGIRRLIYGLAKKILVANTLAAAADQVFSLPASALSPALACVVVFWLCGLWHGVSWTFLVWGLYHGVFLALERTRWGSWIGAAPRLFRHAYASFVVVIGWVIFRADTLPHAVGIFGALFGLSRR